MLVINRAYHKHVCARAGHTIQMASFIVDSVQRPEIITREVGLEKNDRLGTMHTSDHRRSEIIGFTPSYEALGHLISHMSDFSCGETKVRNDP